MLFSRKGKVKF